MTDKLFLDSSYAIALSSPRDQHHTAALELSYRLEDARTPIVTTWAIILEIGNALAKAQHRQAALTLLRGLEKDPSVEIVPLTEELYREGVELYGAHHDTEWGLTDCISFVVMRRRGLRDALTSDHHFRQAGFRILLGES